MARYIVGGPLIAERGPGRAVAREPAGAHRSYVEEQRTFESAIKGGHLLVLLCLLSSVAAMSEVRMEWLNALRKFQMKVNGERWNALR